MSITEKELFNFIFYPDKLSDKKYEFIKTNLDNYKEEIDLLKSTKAGMNESVPENILERIKKKIMEYENSRVVELKKIEDSSDIENEFLTLAADSPDDDSSIKIETYADKLSKILVKVVSSATENKLHIFNKGNEEIRDFGITILPSGTTFQIESSNIPLIIKPKQEIISLYFSF